MRQYVGLTEAMPHDWMIGKRVQNGGTGGKVRNRTLGERTSVEAGISKIVRVFRCWIRTRLWRRHRPRSEQAGILRHGREGGSLAFA